MKVASSLDFKGNLQERQEEKDLGSLVDTFKSVSWVPLACNGKLYL